MGAGVTRSVALPGASVGAEKVTVWVPLVFRTIASAKAWVPASAAVNVYEKVGIFTSGSVLLKYTVPRKPGTGFPAASTAVTVAGRAAPAEVVVGAVTRRPTAPARVVALSAGLARTVTPDGPVPARSVAPSPLKSPAARLDVIGAAVHDRGRELAVALVELDLHPPAAPLGDVLKAVVVEVADLDVLRLRADVIARRRERAVAVAVVDGHRGRAVRVRLRDVEDAVAVEVADFGVERGGAGQRRLLHPEGAVAVVEQHRQRAGADLVGDDEVGVAVAVEVADLHRLGVETGRVVGRGHEGAVALVHDDAHRARAGVRRDDVGVAVAVEVPHRDAVRGGGKGVGLGAWNVPSPLPIRTFIWPRLSAVTRSSLPSPLKSATATEDGKVPSALDLGGLERAVAVAQQHAHRARALVVGRDHVGMAVIVEVTDRDAEVGRARREADRRGEAEDGPVLQALDGGAECGHGPALRRAAEPTRRPELPGPRFTSSGKEHRAPSFLSSRLVYAHVRTRTSAGFPFNAW